MSVTITFDLGPFKESLRKMSGRLRSTVLRKAGREMMKPLQTALKQTVPVAKKEYGPGGQTKRSIGNKVKLYQGRQRSFAGVHGADRVVVIVGPRSDWTKQVQRKFRFIKGKRGVAKFKSTRPQKVQPARVAGLIEKQTKFTARAVAQARRQVIQAATAVLQAGIKGR